MSALSVILFLTHFTTDREDLLCKCGEMAYVISTGGLLPDHYCVLANFIICTIAAARVSRGFLFYITRL